MTKSFYTYRYVFLVYSLQLREDIKVYVYLTTLSRSFVITKISEISVVFFLDTKRSENKKKMMLFMNFFFNQFFLQKWVIKSVINGLVIKP